MKKTFLKITLLSTTLSALLSTISLNALATKSHTDNKTTDSNHAVEISKSENKDTSAVDNSDLKKDETKDEAKYQKIIDDFKKHMLAIKTEFKTQIKEFRQKIKDLNEQKKQAYIKLTTQAQQYLKDEKAFKQKLPIHKRKDLTNMAKEG